MAKNKAIKFDYEEMMIAYNKLLDIQSKSKDALERLEKACDIADNSMKGKYRKGFDDKKKEVFKDFEKTAVDGVRSLAVIMNKASKEMKNVELKVVKNIKYYVEIINNHKIIFYLYIISINYLFNRIKNNILPII